MDLFSNWKPDKRASMTPIEGINGYDERYSPYAEAWKEFDRLQTSARGRGVLGSVAVLGDFALGSLGILEVTMDKKTGFAILFGWLSLRLLQVLRQDQLKRRFQHWLCPRCHAEWPGTKTEKENACKMCGLRLHQISP